MYSADPSIVPTAGHHLPRYLRGHSRDLYLQAYRVRHHADVMSTDAASVLRQLGV